MINPHSPHPQKLKIDPERQMHKPAWVRLGPCQSKVTVRLHLF